jgi:hypothetical protein
MPLLSRAAAYEQSQRKARAVLSFLRVPLYSTVPILAQVMGLKHRPTIHTTLVRMEDAGLIRRATLPYGLTGITLWGITYTGQQYIAPAGEEPNPLTFNISKVSVSRLEHYLAIQQAYVYLQSLGWDNFTYCDHQIRVKRPPKAESKYNVRPDLLAVDPKGLMVAIECEISLKTPSRYKDNIIPGHIRQLNSDGYHYVLWVTKTANDQQTLHQSLTARIKELQQEQRLHLSRTFTDYKMFQFANLQTWLKPEPTMQQAGGQS